MNSPSPNPPTASDDDRRETNSRTRRLLLDIAIGGGLLLALFVVLIIDALRGPAPVDPATETVSLLPGDEQTEAAPLRLAVTPPEFDDMGRLLDSLGHGYHHDTVSYDDFLRPGGLLDQDVVFLTCGGVPTEWLAEKIRDSARTSAGVHRAKPETVSSLYNNLRDFVRSGGTLYVSDLHFDVLLIAFPEFIDDDAIGRGAVQTINAQVVDQGLRKQLGDEIPLRFDMPTWRPAAFRPERVTTYLEGEYELIDGTMAEGPLMVSFPYGKGTVIFTSFHNEAQNSDIEKLLLRYLVFTTVTAREQEEVRQVLVQGGFSPSQRSLLALDTKAQPVSDSYDNKTTGPLQFVLGFANRGAELKLTVTSPNGKRFEKSGKQTFSIPVDRAAPGLWEYTVTPLAVPYRNFPFSLTIGEKTAAP